MTTAVPHLVGAHSDGVRQPIHALSRAIIGRAAILQTVEPAAATALMAHLQPVRFSRRELIYAEGEPGDRLYIVITGKVKLGRRSSDGRSHLLAVTGPSEMFGELSLFDPGPRTATATCLTDVDAVTMDRSVLRAWLAARPEVSDRLLRILARRQRRTDDDLADLVFTDVASRVAKQLLRLTQQFGVHEEGVMRLTHDLTQEEIAQLIGSSRETVNKVLSEFADHGWIRLDGHSMVIAEPESLVRRATEANHPQR